MKLALSPVRVLCLLIVAIASMCLKGNTYASVGASTPFTTYEAEAGTLSGGASIVSLTAPPTTEFSSPALEASGHAYVQLTQTGQSVSWTNNTGQSITAINLRYCIPDSASGGGINSTIDLYVNGSFRQALNLTSTQTWVYESASTYNTWVQSPGSGYYPLMFWDEVHTFITGAAVPPGGTITIQQDASNIEQNTANGASFYYIDCIDLETPPAALSQPANSLSITSYGAATTNADNTTAIQNCINAAQSQGELVWIPSGTFYVNSGRVITANGITIQGAGPWYSTICDDSPPSTWQNTILFVTTSTSVQNVSINCSTTSTASTGTPPTVAGWKDAFYCTGNNWYFNNIWCQHMVFAWEDGSNVTIKGCRINNSFGDAINLNNSGGEPANDILVENNFLRGDGDLAVDDASTSQPTMTNITIQNNSCTALLGAGMAMYGGQDVTVQNNYIADSSRYAALQVGYFNMSNSVQGALVQNNVVLRGGGNAYGQQQQALYIGTSPPSWYTSQSPALPPAYVNNAIVTNNTISNSVYGSVGIGSSSDLVLQNNVISSPFSPFFALAVNPSAVGSGVFNDNVVGGLAQGQSALFEAGVPTYNLQTPNSPVGGVVAASSYNSMSGGVIPETCSEGGTDVGTISNGAYTEYNNVNLNGAVTLAARVASASSGGNVVVHLDSSTGTVIGTATVPSTGGWQTWTTVTCNLSGATGYHNVYLVYTGGGGSLLNIEWFAFQYAGSVIEASSYNNLSNIQTETCAEGGLDVGYISKNSYTEYNNVNLNGVSGFQARVASGGSGGSIAVCLDSLGGTVIGTVAVPPTEGWQTWTTVNCMAIGASGGFHNVYLVYTGQLNVEWFNFTGVMNPTEASSYYSLNNVGTETCSEGGLDVCDILNGSWTEYTNVDLNGTNSFSARVASAGSGGYVNIYEDSPTGTLIGSVLVPITDGWETWTTVTCPVSGASGYHNLYLVYTGGSGSLFNIEWFAFQAAPINTEASSYNSPNNVGTETCVEGGLDVCNILNGSSTEYNNVNLNGAVSFSARVASAGSGGYVNIYEDSPTGTLIGSVLVPITGGWETWTTVTCPLTGASGFHNIYLVYTGGSGNLFNIQWFAFQPSDNQIGAVGYSGIESGTYPSIENCSEGGSDLTNLYNGYYVYYSNINLNGVQSLAIRTASANTSPWLPGVAGVITLNLDSPTGPQIGTCNVNITGGWQTWTTESCPITTTNGTHTIYMNFKGNGGQLFSIEWFDFLQ